ncbi:MAG: hypothetical protein IJX39_08700 [Clostridia bacterium]|nr:hypothetical protein [Clostridia bacterium]
MKKILAITIALLMIAVLALPSFAEDSTSPENNPTGGAEMSTAEVPESVTENTAGEDSASDKSFAEIVCDLVLKNMDAVAIVIYIIYKLVPKIGGIAKNRKQADSLQTTLNEYFGDEKSGKNVFVVQKAVAKAQEAFMNDTSTLLEGIKEAVAPLDEFIKQSKNTEEARAITAKIALAVEGAVDLMASQLNDLVLASPSVGAKKKAEIENAWMEKENEIHALVETVVSANDHKDEV